jgi:hypothetical protein
MYLHVPNMSIVKEVLVHSLFIFGATTIRLETICLSAANKNQSNLLKTLIYFLPT